MLNPEDAVERAVLLAQLNSRSGRRTLLGIVGAPGAGKSTYAAHLVERVRDRGIVAGLVPMDGFHLAHAVLFASGQVGVKGAPQTFDAAGYVALLRRLRESPLGDPEVIWAPAFDRHLEDAVAGSIAVGPEVSLVVTEGNYLLLDGGPWAGIEQLLDECWFIDVDDGVRRSRLAARHEVHGRSRAEAWERTNGSDEANARLVAATRHRADLVVTPAAGRG